MGGGGGPASRARFRASIIRLSPNGFSMKSATPARMASTARGMSPWPVIMMIGTRQPRAFSSRTSSRPVMSGMRMSVITQPAPSSGRASSRARAEAWLTTSKSAASSRKARDSRALSSSSTTWTTASLIDRLPAHFFAQV
jgi:hypothetical protein